MAKKITGCDWAYEIIEGMDDTLKKRFKGPKTNTNRSSSLSRRSGLSETQNPNDSEPVRENLKLGSFEHLAPSAFKQYKAFKQPLLSNVLKEAEKLPRAPRPKIIVVDSAWDFSDPLMPAKVTFLTKECEEINTIRSQSWQKESQQSEPNSLFEKIQTEVYNPTAKALEKGGKSRYIDHGAACVGVLRISNKQTDHKRLIWGYRKDDDIEASLWNLASRCDIILLPAREHEKISKKAFTNCLETARQSNFLNQKEFDLFSEQATFDIVSQAIQNESSHTYDLLRKEAWAIITKERCIPDINMKGKFIAPNPIIRHIVKTSQSPGSDDINFRKNTKAIIDKLFSCIAPALDEAGLTATLELLCSAGAQGYIGRGDTLVIPMEIQMWRRHKRDQPESPLVHSHNNLTAADFFINQPTETCTPDNRQKVGDINRIDLPIIAYRNVENKVRTLTCSHKVSVVISAGNSHIDLGQISIEKLDKFLPTKRFEQNLKGKERKTKINRENRRLFQSRGVYCGATIVGSGIVELSSYWIDPLNQRFTHKGGIQCSDVNTHQVALKESLKSSKDHRAHFPNYGLCIDASGRGSTTSLINAKSLVVQDSSYLHWSGASIAAMVTAACIANVQHIRLLNDYISIVKYATAIKRGEKVKSPPILRPLKPYEARAHIQQWRSNDSFKYECLFDLMGAAPDIKAWFEGSCFYNDLQTYARKGRGVIKKRYQNSQKIVSSSPNEPGLQD